MRRWLCAVGLAVVSGRDVAAQDTWGALPPGPHAVGFASQPTLDHGRRYRTEFDSGATYGGGAKAPRPILVQRWYPATVGADAAPMRHGDYFDVVVDERAAERPALERFRDALRAFAVDVAANQLLDEAAAEFDQQQRDLFARALGLPTRAHRDAPAADGRFPLVVYHSGANSSFEDNAAFCEFLASHGFVVLGSAFQRADGSGLGVDAGDGSVRDLEFLARYGATLPYVDWRRCAFCGHSAGAQACLRAQLRPDCPADALVLLDTTIDYYTEAVPTFSSLTGPVLENVDAFVRPMLVFAGPTAAFSMCDALTSADRTYVTIPELGHDEFAAQGVLRRRVQEWLREARGDAAPDPGEPSSAAISRRFATTCEAARAFLAAQLGADDAAWRTLRTRWAGNVAGGGEPYLESAPPGTSGPAPYEPGADRPPTPRQLVALLRSDGARAVLTALDAHVDRSPKSPIYDARMLHASMCYGLVLADRLDDARALHAWHAGRGLDVLTTLRFLAFMDRALGRPARARKTLQVALAIAPDDPKSLEELRRLEEPPTGR